VVPLITLAVLIAGSLALFGLDALDGPIQVALKNGHTWEEVQRAGQGPGGVAYLGDKLSPD
jgi:NhaC family Na+:H+ antiporter